MRVTAPAASVALVRPLTPLASEVRPRVRLPASEPAATAVTPTLPAAPAAMAAGLVTETAALAAVAATRRESWKAAELTTALVTAREVAAPRRTLPRASEEAKDADARS